MTAPHNKDAQLRDIVREAERLLALDAQDDPKAIEVLKQLKEFEIHAQHSTRAELKAVCDLAMSFCEQAVRKAPVSEAQLRGWIKQCLDMLAASLGIQFDGAKKPQPDAVAPANRQTMLSSTNLVSRLSLADGNRLGEILVRLSYLKPEQIAKALELQRKDKSLFGQALVALDLVSAEELDSALKVQKNKRLRGTDTWSPNFGHDGPAPDKKVG